MTTLERDLSRPQLNSPMPDHHSANRKLEERLEIFSSRLEELTKLINLKTERLSVRQRMNEERQDEMAIDFQKRLTTLVTKSAEMPKMELKIQELIERQNQVIRNFENRMNHFRKVIENQEIQMYRALTELEEARREIARLKRA